MIPIMINKNIKALAGDINEIANGNLTKPVDDKSFIREISEMAGTLEGMRQRLQEVIGGIIEKARAVDEGASLTE